jgi:hypothetical protein
MRSCLNNKILQDRGGIILSGLRVLLFLLLISLDVSGQDDTTKNDSLDKLYALDDPRNPDCPCHQLQKQAENEYKALNNNKELPAFNEKEINKETIVTKSSVQSSSPVRKIKSHNNKNHLMFRMKNKLKKYFARHKKIKVRHTLCFFTE